MRIAMIGTGYVGLVSGACFSEFGHQVICVDRDEGRIQSLRNGEIPFHEPGLPKLVSENVAAGRLVFSNDLVEAVREADAVFIAVGTPSRRLDGDADLTYVFAAAREIAQAARDDAIVVTKSTVPVGTGAKIVEIIRALRPRSQIEVASNPEFLREGSAIEDFMRPDRVVCGIGGERAQQVLRAIYRPLFLNETPMMFTEIAAAEMIKYAANSFLALKVGFINQIADLCEKTGVSVQDVARGIGLDRRIGSKFLHAGPGYGGSCFPKDTRALAFAGRANGAPMTLIEALVESNDSRKKAMADKIIASMGGDVRGKTIAVLGLTFKPNTDDMRDSPSLEIIPALQKAGAVIRAFDPEGMREAAKLLRDVTFCANAYEAMDGADAAVIVTEWNEFRALDLGRAKSLLKRPLLIDLRNIYTHVEMEGAGFDYISIGRKPIFAAKNK